MDLFARLGISCSEAPRTAVVSAHPDDEVIGAGGILADLASLAPPLIVHLTDGAPRDSRFVSPHARGSREAYARTRRTEVEAALARAGIGGDRIRWAGGVDQEAATHMVELARVLARIVDVEAIDIVITHPYEGGHPDHDAAAFCARAAAELVRRDEGREVAIVEMTSYHAGPNGLEVGRFLPNGDDAVVLTLDDAARERKREMLACFATQREVLAPFGVDEERFRRAPVYRFDQPPHAGPLHYEAQGWPMRGDAWRSLARNAWVELFGASPESAPPPR